VKLLKHWVVEDCGQVINPLLADEQIRGGVVQGIGAALYEECLYDERASSQRLDGRLPGADGGEMPDIVVAHVETPVAGTALGVKGIGEAGTIGAAAASATRSTMRSRPSAPRCCSSPIPATHPRTPLKIAELRERTVSIAAPMRNARDRFDAMTASAVAMVSDRGITGYAFDSIGRYGKGALLRERFFPALVGARLCRRRPDRSAGLRRAAMANEKPAATASARAQSRSSRPRRGTCGPSAGVSALALDRRLLPVKRQRDIRVYASCGTSAPTTCSPTR
jgi:hypothetical protein